MVRVQALIEINYFQDYTFESTSAGDNIIFLSSEEQSLLDVKFVKNLPWNTFGRKNVGYLYAIANGAKVIWDFDDDNSLKFWLKKASPDDVLEIDSYIENLEDIQIVEPILDDPKVPVFNPYPSLGSDPKCWPRGFPLDRILQSHNSKMESVNKSVKFGVLQSLADYQPDVDAIYRLTQKTPFNFKRPPVQKLEGEKNPLLQKGQCTSFCNTCRPSDTDM